MVDVSVRAVEESDLPRIADLTESVFGVRRDVALLRWLLGLERSELVDAWVAERDGEVVGHTGVLKSRYQVAERRVTGAHAFLWMVDPRYRGEAGVALARTIVGYRDFLIVLGGTPTTRAILAGRRFTRAAEAVEFRVDAEPPGAFDGFDLMRRTEAAEPRPRYPAGVAANEAAPGHLEWLADCPELEAHRLVLTEGGRDLGAVLLFVNRRVSPVAGRLVHLPYLGEATEVWSAALARIAVEMSRLGCSSWTLLATHPALVEACETAGAEPANSRPVWIRERGRPAAVSASPVWHLTYLEGDLAYRRVEPAPAAVTA